MAAIPIDQLRSRVRGSIVRPGDATYDSVRRVYNGMIDNPNTRPRVT